MIRGGVIVRYSIHVYFFCVIVSFLHFVVCSHFAAHVEYVLASHSIVLG